MIRTLDKQFQNLRRLDVLKIDVEGMEAEVLHGSAKLLTEFAPLIWMEHKPYNRECGQRCRLVQWLRQFGYLCESPENVNLESQDILICIDRRMPSAAELKERLARVLISEGM